MKKLNAGHDRNKRKREGTGMDDRELLNKIKESAGPMKVPRQLEPEQIQARLEGRMRVKKRWYKMATAAACLCLCFGIGSVVYSNSNRIGADVLQQNQPGGTTGDIQSSVPAENGTQTSRADSAGQEQKQDTEAKPEQPMKKIGKMYTLASDYKEVYRVLKKSSYWSQKGGSVINRRSESQKEAIGDFAETEDVQYDGGASGSVDFSTTNLQVEGVDESDIVKTDGQYIYVVQDDKVQILSTKDRIPKVVGQIVPDTEEGLGTVCEIYVSGHELTLILQAEKTAIAEKISAPQDSVSGGGTGNSSATQGASPKDGAQEDDKAASSEKQVGNNTNSENKEKQESKLAAADIAYRMDVSVDTKVLNYDISTPQKPVLKDTAIQDGWYETSRKIGSRLYLFTTQSMYPDEQCIPYVNGRAIPADCIYLPRKGNQGLVMSSIDLQEHSKVLDSKLLVHDYAKVYVSQSSVYLYYSDYTKKGERTRIARFGLDADGIIRAKAAAAVKGEIQDTFAIHEREGYLQVLTSITDQEEWENSVYVLDEDLKITGKITGIAKGEMIYAARFVGSIGYFVTYRNTDPLFSVDFSDPSKPRIIGKLKVTGFSEYLHFWSDTKMLGIGFETNPQDGSIVGVKLSMFDISDPLKVKEKARLVLNDADHCDAMFDYKCVLVDPQKNVIAFTTEDNDAGGRLDYRVFSFKNGKFNNKLTRVLRKKYSYRNGGASWRSLYIGDVLYLVNARKAFAFDMGHRFQEIGKVNYSN